MQCPICFNDTLRTTNSYPAPKGSAPAIIRVNRMVCSSCRRIFTGVYSAIVTDPGAKGFSNLPWIPGLADAAVVELPQGSGTYRIVLEQQPLLHPKTQRPLDDGGRPTRIEVEFLLASLRMANPRPSAE